MTGSGTDFGKITPCVPCDGVLTTVIFALRVSQLGPLIVLPTGATAWARHSPGGGWAAAESPLLTAVDSARLTT